MALLLVNIANVHSRRKEYEIALVHYQEALTLQQASLPTDHPDIARTLHNLAQLHALQGNTEKANNTLQQANSTIGLTLSSQHPLRSILAESIVGKINLNVEDEVIIVRL